MLSLRFVWSRVCVFLYSLFCSHCPHPVIHMMISALSNNVAGLFQIYNKLAECVNSRLRVDLDRPNAFIQTVHILSFFFIDAKY